jgi:hypothetical protein
MKSAHQSWRTFLHNRSRVFLACLLVFCTTVGVASGSIAASCVARDLDFGQKSVGWAHLPLSKLKRDTVYTLINDGGRNVLRGAASSSASFYAVNLKPPTAMPAILSWRWKTDALVPGADNREKSREDAPLRVIAAFDGDRATLPDAEQQRFRRARALSGRDLPYAVLMYIWSEQVALETIIPSAHTSQVKMLVVTSGASGLEQWQSLRRNVAEDYRRVFGAAPGRLLGVAVMTDTDNTGETASGLYADLRLECPGK